MSGSARANTVRSEANGRRKPSFLVRDVASLAFPRGSLDLVVSTLSMHDWADPSAGLAGSAACSALGSPGRSPSTSSPMSHVEE